MIDKRAIAHAFSQAASTYDQVSYFQRDVGERLLHSMQDGKVEHLLDVGSGTGYFSDALEQFAKQIINLDLAQGMLSFAKNRRAKDLYICGDAELLPLAQNSVDCIFANLSLQWCYQLDTLCQEFARVLKPGGRIYFSTLSDGTLKELAAAWAEAAPNSTHVNSFLPTSAWQRPFDKAALTIDQHSHRQYVLEFDRVETIMRELKALGARNLNSTRPQALTGKQTFKRLAEGYERYRNEGKLPLTYEVDFWGLRL